MLEPMPWPCCAKAGVPRNKAMATAKNEMLIMRFIGTSQLILNPQAGSLTHSDNMVRRSKVHVLPSVPHTEGRRPGAPSLRVLRARMGFHNCLIHGTLIARYPVTHPQLRPQWNPTLTSKSTNVRMGHPLRDSSPIVPLSLPAYPLCRLLSLK